MRPWPSAIAYSLAQGVALRIFVSLSSSMGGLPRNRGQPVYPAPFQCTHSVPEDAGCPRTVANRTGRQYMAKCLILRGFLLIGGRARTRKNGAGKPNGAQGRNRTTDTAIFSRMLYQLSYLGICNGPKGLSSGRFIVGWRGPVHLLRLTLAHNLISLRVPARSGLAPSA